MEKLRQTDFSAARQGEIRDRLINTMVSRSISQASVSRETRMSSGHVNHLIKGRRPITPKLVLILAKAVGVSAHWLETGEGHPDDVDAKATPGLSGGHVDPGALSIDQVGKLLAAAERERLTPDERALLVKYQSLPPSQRARLWDLLNAGAADPPEPPARMLNDGETRKGKG